MKDKRSKKAFPRSSEPAPHTGKSGGTPARTDADALVHAPLRIVGGQLRGRKLAYERFADPQAAAEATARTRPMKDRVRESVFNLIGPDVVGKRVLDVFAGTGALGFEALSRGAHSAIFVEQHFPTAALVRQSADYLGVAERCTVRPADAFIWAQRELPGSDIPWLAFISPPWAFFAERPEEMLALVTTLVEKSPPGSLVVTEADVRFDFAQAPRADEWDVREYFPAVVGVWRSRVAPTEQPA